MIKLLMGILLSVTANSALAKVGFISERVIYIDKNKKDLLYQAEIQTVFNSVKLASCSAQQQLSGALSSASLGQAETKLLSPSVVKNIKAKDGQFKARFALSTSKRVHCIGVSEERLIDKKKTSAAAKDSATKKTMSLKGLYAGHIILLDKKAPAQKTLNLLTIEKAEIDIIDGPNGAKLPAIVVYIKNSSEKALRFSSDSALQVFSGNRKLGESKVKNRTTFLDGKNVEYFIYPKATIQLIASVHPEILKNDNLSIKLMPELTFGPKKKAKKNQVLSSKLALKGSFEALLKSASRLAFNAVLVDADQSMKAFNLFQAEQVVVRIPYSKYKKKMSFDLSIANLLPYGYSIELIPLSKKSRKYLKSRYFNKKIELKPLDSVAVGITTRYSRNKYTGPLGFTVKVWDESGALIKSYRVKFTEGNKDQ